MNVTPILSLERLPVGFIHRFNRDLVLEGLFPGTPRRAWIGALHLSIPSTREEREHVKMYTIHSYVSEDHLKDSTPFCTDIYLNWDGFDVTLKLELLFKWNENHTEFLFDRHSLVIQAVTRDKNYVVPSAGIGAALCMYLQHHVKVVGFDLNFEPIVPTPEQ